MRRRVGIITLTKHTPDMVNAPLPESGAGAPVKPYEVGQSLVIESEGQSVIGIVASQFPSLAAEPSQRSEKTTREECRLAILTPSPQ
jgi:hypothetical protein